MNEILQRVIDGIAGIGGEDPFIRGIVLLASGLVALVGLAYSVLRGGRSKSQLKSGKVQINLDLLEDQDVSIIAECGNKKSKRNT
jgi:hypothetical protein